ncbi:MAG: hypothetical protein RLY86_3953 [Pseudomonadota bacterium]|jgi:uncharacterized protein YuzE
MNPENTIFYDPAADILRVELRPWPEGGDPSLIGGADAEENLVIHYAGDGLPWAWEVEQASRRPDLVTRALTALRNATGVAEAA